MYDILKFHNDIWISLGGVVFLVKSIEKLNGAATSAILDSQK